MNTGQASSRSKDCPAQCCDEEPSRPGRHCHLVSTYGRCDPSLLNKMAEEVVRRGHGLSGDDLLIGLARSSN
eukprot:933812-Amphidinium_carterae.2